MKHFRHSFLCKATLLLASIFLFNIIFVHQPTHAYFKDDCYAGEWLVDVSKTTNQAGQTEKVKKTYRTDQLCVDSANGKLVKGGNGGVPTVAYPKFDIVDENTVKITYCKDSGPTLPASVNNKTLPHKCKGKSEKEISADWNRDSPKDFANKIQVFLESSKKRDGFELTGLDENKNVDETTNSKSKCKSASKYLGWILCPVIELAGEAADGAYNEYIAPMLNIEPKLFAGGENGAEGAWGTFRNFANIIFIILLLFIIFSQLTGVGIDNYGIKKSLPKMIIGAILINLSYILCVVAVDVSNILGNAFQALFTTLGESLKPELGKSITGGDVQSIVVTGGSLVGLGVFGYAVSTVAAPMVLLSLVMAAISLVSAIFFLFILLAAREAAIVVLTVISPVAIVLYALPNTKSYFDKWLSSFKALLMVYPIAGLLVGGGNYVSALLLVAGGGGGAVEDFSVALTAMVVSVVPIFFIPAVLKNSLAAFGNIGSKIASFGSGFVAGSLATGASNAIQRNARFQNWQRESGRNRAERDYKKVEDRMKRKAGVDASGKIKYENLNAAQQRALSRAQSTAKALKDEDIDTQMTLINAQTNNGADEDKLDRIYRSAVATGNEDIQVAAARIAGKEGFSAQRFAEAHRGNITTAAAKEITTGQYAGNYKNNAAMDYAFLNQVNKGKEDPGDWSSWSKDSDKVGDAMSTFVESADDLTGLKGASLKEILSAAQGNNPNMKFNDNTINDIKATVDNALKQHALTPGKLGTEKFNLLQDFQNDIKIEVKQEPPSSPSSPSPSSSSSPSPSSPPPRRSPSSSSSPSPSSPPPRRSGGIDIPH